jgi:copper chaperone NosL
MNREPSRINRRTVLGAIGAETLVTLAGCVGGDDSETGEDNDEQTDDESEETDADGTESLNNPIDVPDGESCAVCNMVAAEYPAWNAQLVHENGTRVFFCSSGCLSAYHAEPQRFEGPDSPLADAWVTGYETGDILNVNEAAFVRVTDSDHVDDIMMMNPTPFRDRDDAVSFVDGFEAYSEEDIIDFGDFDRELALLYRGKFFDEERR